VGTSPSEGLRDMKESSGGRRKTCSLKIHLANKRGTETGSERQRFCGPGRLAKTSDADGEGITTKQNLAQRPVILPEKRGRSGQQSIERPRENKGSGKEKDQCNGFEKRSRETRIGGWKACGCRVRGKLQKSENEKNRYIDSCR